MTWLRLHLLDLLLVLAVSGCQHLGAKALPPSPSPAPVAARPQDSPFTPGYLRAEEIPGEIAKLAWLSRNPEATEAERTEALRRLALLHLAPKNPARSLAMAAEAQADYLTMQPPETARQEGEIWLNLIREGLAREHLQQQQSQKIREKEGTL
ncbi:MAG TPA: hypothetical protein VLA15_07255, partial [Desulfurivibrionaceae bacterium]|nr:hypothetical protein [Desulfurivibrionaceae bacterium]